MIRLPSSQQSIRSLDAPAPAAAMLSMSSNSGSGNASAPVAAVAQMLHHRRHYRVTDGTNFFFSWKLRRASLCFVLVGITFHQIFAPKRKDWHVKNKEVKSTYYKEFDEKYGYTKQHADHVEGEKE